jgi:hypothetical protein
MKRQYSFVLAIVIGVVLHAAPARAGLCVPQSTFAFAALQNCLTGLGESIDVLTQQEEGLVWGTDVSTNASMSILFQVAGNPNQDEFGIVGFNATGSLSGLCPVFPPDKFNVGYFAVASFRSGGVLRVNLFDATATVINTFTYSGMDRSRFVYYLKNDHGTYFSHMGYNADGKVHSLVFAGTNANRGNWWMAWEDSANPTDQADYNDGLLFLSSLNPTPVSHASWGAVKARFR